MSKHEDDAVQKLREDLAMRDRAEEDFQRTLAEARAANEMHVRDRRVLNEDRERLISECDGLRARVVELEAAVSEYSDCSQADSEWNDGLRAALEDPPLSDHAEMALICEDALDEIKSLRQCVILFRDKMNVPEFVEEEIVKLKSRIEPGDASEVLSVAYEAMELAEMVGSIMESVNKHDEVPE